MLSANPECVFFFFFTWLKMNGCCLIHCAKTGNCGLPVNVSSYLGHVVPEVGVGHVIKNGKHDKKKCIIGTVAVLASATEGCQNTARSSSVPIATAFFHNYVNDKYKRNAE